MSSSARKKEKHRLKRKEKKQQIQRMNSRTALQRLAAEGGELECWITPDWNERGMASIQVLGRAPGGRGAFAAFLVDLWAVGLKDAFGRSDVPWLDFREDNLERWVEQTGAVEVDAHVARRLVAGGVRFGRQNGFRMPPGWEKLVVIFGRGILEQIPTADLSDFGIDGGVRYVGTEEFLEKRLAIPPEQFLSRPDVHSVMEVDPEIAADEDEDETDDGDIDGETIESLYQTTRAGTDRIIEEVQQWITDNHAEPIPLLDQAAKISMFSLVPAMASLGAGQDPTDEERRRSEQLVEMMLAAHDPQELPVLAASIERLQEIVRKIDAEPSDAPRLQTGSAPIPADRPTPNEISEPTPTNPQ